jgi:hypothetical protein
MGLARWRYRVGPPSILLLGALILTAAAAVTLSAANDAAAATADCGSVTPASAARAALATASGAPPALRLSAQLTKRGELVGRSFAAQSGSGGVYSVSLPVESFVGKPAGDLVLYTRYTAAAGSEVRGLNSVTGCDVRLAAPPEIVRSAVLDANGANAYVHSVFRAGRADAGVTRYELETGRSLQVVPPLPPSDDIGPIFGTELHWSTDGNALAVQSCGISNCVSRVLDTRTGGIAIYDAQGQGEFIVLTGTHLVTFADCAGLPGAVLSADLATGAMTTLADEAFGVTLTATDTGRATVAITTAAGVLEVEQ